MSERLDTQLRNLSAAMVANPPPPRPLIEEPTRPPRARRRRAAVVALAVLALVAGSLVALSELFDGESTTVGNPSTTTPRCVPDPGPRENVDGTSFGSLGTSAPSVDQTFYEALPDFLSVACPDSGGIIGYLRKSDMFMLQGSAVILRSGQNAPVYSLDGSTVIGRMVPNAGFVALGEDPGERKAPSTSTLPLSPSR